MSKETTYIKRGLYNICIQYAYTYMNLIGVVEVEATFLVYRTEERTKEPTERQRTF